MTPERLHTIHIDREVDLVGLRQQSRSIAELFGFDTHGQTRIATAVSEIARHASAKGAATVSFSARPNDGTLIVGLESRFDPALETSAAAQPGTGDEGLMSARRLMDEFTLERDQGVETITLEKHLPRSRPTPSIATLRKAMSSFKQLAPDLVAEMRAQNRELLLGLSEVKDKQDALERLNHELENTNRGVVALYAELDEKTLALLELNRTLEQRVDEAVRERERVQEALRQSQKMEAVGQLTGGIAHDFNNLLQAITGNLELVTRHMPVGLPRLERSLAHAMRAATSAASLTQRLLAFSRQQALAPRNVDVCQLVTGMSDLLRRTLGEMVEIRTLVPTDPCVIEIDAHELENALLNLAVNARDAMPGGGMLTIEVRSEVVCQPDPDALEPAPPTGTDYVLISVRDTGMGMPPEIRAKVFEPFFTTKEVGKGTGLGLSMVYGFAKQSGGDILLHSVVAEGTTVTLSFPRLAEGATKEAPDEPVALPVHGNETVLVVEDDPDVLAYSCGALQELGYRVLTAMTSQEALVLLETQTVDLLFSDVILGGVTTGKQLAEQAIAMRPALRVLFTSGYARNALENVGRLEVGMELIGKPFTFAELASRVHAVLRMPREWLPALPATSSTTVARTIAPSETPTTNR